MKCKKSIPFKFMFLSIVFSCLFAFVSFAADGLIYFSDPEVKAGDTVEVTMTVQSDQTKIGDVNVILQYPAEALEFKKGTSASGGAGTIRVHGKGTKDGDHKMSYSLTFKTSLPGEYTVNINSNEVYDDTGAVINITHAGSSKITVTGDSAAATGNVCLSSLEVTPGTLQPEFTPENTAYSVTVGLSVEHLTINALPADSTSNVSVVGNEDLKEGENDVVIYVKSNDGLLQNEYHINVLKKEGGEENLLSSTESAAPEIETTDGVQLSCKGKTITIMETGEEVTAPEGYRESQIKIDGQPVKGWITGEDASPEYFLVYGMNDKGELNFYRYDLSEKTIQRFFSDAINNDPRDSEDYQLLETQYQESKKTISSGKLILTILAIIALLMLGIVIYLAVRLSSVSKELDKLQDSLHSGKEPKRLDPVKSKRTRSSERREVRDDAYEDEEDDDEYDDEYDEDADNDEDDIKFRRGGSVEDAEDATIVRSSRRDSSDSGETKVLPGSVRRRVSRKASAASEETTVIRRTSRRHRNTDSEF